MTGTTTSVDDLPDEEVWVTGGDVRIPLVAMGETHLRNATNYMRRALEDASDFDAELDGSDVDDMEEKLAKLEREVNRRLNAGINPQSLPITPARQAAEDEYKRGRGL